MIPEKTILVATDGQAVIRSHDRGKTWKRLQINQDLEFDGCVRCLLPDPNNEYAVFAGAEGGLFYSEDCGVNWHRVDSALNGHTVWKLVVDEHDSNIMYAGTGSPGPAIFFRSRDGGKSWEETALKMPLKCAGVSRPRMLAMCIDPDDARHVLAGVEEGGLYETLNAGDTWKRIDTEWPEAVGNSDVHSIVVFPGTPKTIVVMVVNALYRSTDGGRHWERTIIREHWGIYYSRVLKRKERSDNELFMGIGDGTPGTTSMFLRSLDRGATWQTMPLPVQPNSCLWAIGTNKSDPDFVLSGTKYGYLFSSLDGGQSWRKEWREFSEITDIIWLPSVPEDTGVEHRAIA